MSEVEKQNTLIQAKPRIRPSSNSFQIAPLTDKVIQDVAKIHRMVLPQTFSSRLGQHFVESQYQILLRDTHARGWIATQATSVVGVITATLDLHATEHFLKSKISYNQKARALLRVLTNSYDFVAFVSHCRMTQYCRRFGRPYPILLTLGVIPGTMPTIAYKLMDAAHTFYKESGLSEYFLDTLADNQRAQEFYRLLGFEKQGRIAGNLILRRKI